MVFLTFANIVVISLAAFRGIEYMDSAAVLRPGVPHGDAAGVHGLPGRAARARRLRRVPHRPRRAVVRQVQAVGHPPAVRGGAQDLPDADPVAGREPASGARHVRAVPLAGEVHRRPRRASSASSPTTRRTPRRRRRCRLHVGSGSQAGAHGIHWHMAPSTKVTYVTTDEKRQNIIYVKVEDEGRRPRVPRRGRDRPSRSRRGERRQMDCMDCHNRPSHRFDSTPERAVNDGLAHGGAARVAAVRAAGGGRGAEGVLRLAGGGAGGHRRADDATSTRSSSVTRRPRARRRREGDRRASRRSTAATCSRR